MREGKNHPLRKVQEDGEQIHMLKVLLYRTLREERKLGQIFAGFQTEFKIMKLF